MRFAELLITAGNLPSKQAKYISGGINMFSYIWPIALVICSNAIYQICAKSVPKEMNPFASLTVTYLIAAGASGALFFFAASDVSLWKECAKANWASIVLGLVIVGLEAGWICAYKAGWPISTGFIVQSAVLAGVLLLLGYYLYHEPLTLSKVAGVILCLIGLMFLNR